MTTGTKTMDQRVRDPGHGVIIGFPTDATNKVGVDLDTLKTYFFRVARTQRLYYEYDNIGALNEGDTVDFGYLGDTGIGSGNDVLRVGEDDFHAYHFGFSPEDPNLNVYTSVSPSSSTDKALSRRGRDNGPSPGDPRGFFSSRRAGNVYDPPAETERVSFRNDKDGEFLEFGFEATDDITEENSTLHVIGRGYKLLPVTDTDTQDRMLDVVLSGDTEDADLPTIITQVGGLGSYDLGTETPDSWEDSFARSLDYPVPSNSNKNRSRQTPGR
jgi:hypothetical protein